MAEELKYTSDSFLWDNFLKGDRAAFHAIYCNNVQQLFRYGYNFTNDQDLIKDCIHDIFIELYKYRTHLSPTSNIKLYLFKALNHCIVRTLVKQNKISQLKNENIPFLYTVSYEEELINNESISYRVKQVERAFLCLTNRQKEAIYLRFISELNYDEISQVMDMNYQSVRNLVYRGLEKLRESYCKNGSIVLFSIIMNIFFEKYEYKVSTKSGYFS
jgi:RNA polymerase sigma factor (sigma-70 family)